MPSKKQWALIVFLELMHLQTTVSNNLGIGYFIGGAISVFILGYGIVAVYNGKSGTADPAKQP